jgi:hypothetical protein
MPVSERIARRRFLTGSAAAVGISLEEKALLAHESTAKESSPPAEPSAGLPMGKIGEVEISRLIIGSNLFFGGAHARDLLYVSELLHKYFTPDKIMDTLQLCEENGINTNIGGVNHVRRYRKERGGRMQVIAQLDPDNFDWSDDSNTDGAPTTTKKEVIAVAQKAVDQGCVGAFILGARADRYVKAGRLDLIDEFVSFVKKNGLIAGVGGHDKRVPMDCESSGIDADFYFKTIHPDTYWSALSKEERRPFLVDSFGADDHDCHWAQYPEETIRFMQTLKKPWIGFKVLAAGAVHPREGFRYAFENGADFACAGMFDWQVREDVGIARDVLSDAAVVNRRRAWS